RAYELWQFTEVNFAKVAESMGALGIRVERPGELRGALERAFASGKPAVVDVVTDIEALAPLPYEG
ncbi:MAG: thiamine pyrophosphate-dependent enzyme, partial [Nitrospinota bacterium]